MKNKKKIKLNNKTNKKLAVSKIISSTASEYIPEDEKDSEEEESSSDYENKKNLKKTKN